MATDVETRQFTGITVNVHAESMPDALRKLGDEIEARKALTAMACMSIWISEPTAECGKAAKKGLCASAIYADPLSGRMLD